MIRNLERGRRYESIATDIARVAAAYGFSAPPVSLSRASLAKTNASDAKAAASMALLSGSRDGATQSWGFARKGAGTVIAFSVTASRQVIANALVVRTALAVAELAGFSDLSVSISSAGDAESRKRFARELGNFFRKNHDALAEDIRALATANPEAAYRALATKDDALLARAPRSIDYLSEPSRRNMLAVLSLFESVGIPYAMNPRLVANEGQSELLFGIEGTGKRGERLMIATGGRFDEHLKKERGKPESGVSVALEVPERVDYDALDEEPACFVVHVGDAAKLKAFAVLEALWRAHLAVGQALLAETLRDQMQKGALSKTRYLAIIGQREALDGTVIVRNVATQMQTVLPVEKLTGYVSRTRRS